MNFGLRNFLTVSIGVAGLMAVSATQAQDAVPTWELGKDAIDPATMQGKIEMLDGVVKLDCMNSFAIPASVLGAQEDYTIELEFRRSAKFKTLPRMEGALRLVSNRDATAHAGLSLIYFPPEWDMNGGVSNKTGIDVNAYWNGEAGGLDGEAFNKYSIVVKNKLASIYRNGLLLAMTGEVKPSQLPLTIGGMGWRGDYILKEGEGQPVPIPYELRNLKIYDKALSPTGFDRSTEMMRNCSGEGYSIQRADVKDPSLPRILVIGDSISMGYRGFITKHFKDKAYVDYWVGGGWLDPKDFEAKEPRSKIAFKGVLSQGPYDVVSWNSMTLHMWKPNMPHRCPEDSIVPNFSNMVEFLKAEAPKTQFIWIRCTPVRAIQPDGTQTLDGPDNERMVKYNSIVDTVMKKGGIPEVDLYAIAEKQSLASFKGSQDTVHWGSEISKLFAAEIINEIEKYLPQQQKQNPGK